MTPFNPTIISSRNFVLYIVLISVIPLIGLRVQNYLSVPVAGYTCKL